MLSHKRGGKYDIQSAIWFLLTGDGSHSNTAEYRAMIADAAANGAGFAPATGQPMAVVLWEDGVGGYQDTFIEVPAPATGRIGDRVWMDTNRNGIQDAGEAGITGVTVMLKDGSGATLATTSTGADGAYEFTGLPAGIYSVALDETFASNQNLLASPAGQGGDQAVDSSRSGVEVSLTDGENDPTVDFGYMPECSGRIGNLVWLDSNRNGIQDEGEAGINNVRIRLLSSGVEVGSALTENGAYLFDGLCAGDYTVVVNEATLPAGYVAAPVAQGTPDVDSNGNGATVTLAQFDSEDLSVDFGYMPPCAGVIGSTVWHDLNANGIKEADEPGIAGVTVNLLLAGEPFATRLTGADGVYQFTGLCPGDYTVDLGTGVPSNWTPATPPAGGDVTGIIITHNEPYPVAVTTASPDNATANFGFVSPCAGSIGDLVWHDADRDGLFDAGEQGLAGVTVKLYDYLHQVLATATTDAAGAYIFTGLCKSTAEKPYAVEVTPPAGYAASPVAPGGNVGSPKTGIALGIDEVNASIDFGYYMLPGAISGVAYADANFNKSLDSGETTLANVAITLTNSSGSVVASALTGADGSYNFPNLTPGSYKVGSAASASGLSLETAASLAVTLAAGGTSANNNFGYVGGAISGFAYTESNCNGTFDAGETPLPGVTVTLKSASGQVLATAVTGADGSYKFSTLAGGSYTVSVPATASGEKLKTSSPLSVTLPAGGVKTNVNFGYDAGSITGLAFSDCDKDKKYDSGESKLSGVTITLSGTDVNGKKVSQTTTTASDGTYNFKGLAAGNYTVTAATTAQGRLIETTNPLAVTLAAAQDSASNNFGYIHVTVSGVVYVDSNGNGKYDSGETTLSGVKVTLTGKDSAGKAYTLTATTSCNGAYTFSNVSAGAVVIATPATVSGKASSTTNPLSLTIAGAVSYPNNNFGYGVPVTVTCGSSTATIGQAYSSSMKATGGFAPYTFSVSAGALPTGVKLNASTGALSGTPTAAGTFKFTARVTDSHSNYDTESCSIVVASGLPTAGSYTTYTQGGWGATPSGNNPAALLAAKFGVVYSGSVSIGGAKKITFTSACNIKAFLPAGGSAGSLNASQTNPSNTAAGVFAGQVLALELNVDFSKKGITKQGLANLKVVSGELAGYTVQQVLDLANAVLGGNSSALPKCLTLAELNCIVDAINNNFDGGTVAKGFLK